MQPSRLLLIASMALVNAGCAGYVVRSEVRDDAIDIRKRVETAADSLPKPSLTETPLVETVVNPYFGREIVPLSKSASLPLALRRDVDTKLWMERWPSTGTGEVEVPIADFAATISKATGIPTRVKPDVYFSRDMLVPGGKQITTAPAANSFNAVGQAPTPPMTTGSTVKQEKNAEVMIRLKETFSGPLPRLLEEIAARTGISTRYTDDGHLEFYRLLSKSFRLEAPDSKSLNEVFDLVKVKMTPAGTAAVSPSSGSLMISDLPSVIADIESMILEENRSFLRQVTVRVQSFSVRSKRDGASGLDVSLFYKALGRYGYNIGLAGPGSAVPETAGALDLRAISGGANTSRFEISQAVIRALEEAGEVVDKNETVLRTSNRTTAEFHETNIFDYVSKTTAQASQGAVAVGVETKEDKAGVDLKVKAQVIGDRSVRLGMVFATSTRNPERSFTSGRGEATSTVQLRDKQDRTISQDPVVRVGEPLIITGIDSLSAKESTRSFGPGVPALLGGGVQGSRNEVKTILVVTAFVQD